jgi:hypothetical protein
MVREEVGDRMFRFGIEPSAAAVVSAVIDAYRRQANGVDAELERLIGQKVTLVQHGSNMLGAEMIRVQEGRLFPGRLGLAILPKGRRKKGFVVDPHKVLEVVEGWDVGEAEERVMVVRSQFPQLRPLTQERLLELPRHGSGKDCSMAVFGSHPLFGSHDALWLVGEYWPTDDIVERCVLLLRPEHGYSESGSVFGSQLLNMPVGEVVDFEPIAWADALELTSMEYDEAFARALPNVTRPVQQQP